MGCSGRPTRKWFFGFTYASTLAHEWQVIAVVSKPFGMFEIVDGCPFCGKIRHLLVSEKIVVQRFGFLPDTGIYGSLLKYEIDAQADARGVEHGNKS